MSLVVKYRVGLRSLMWQGRFAGRLFLLCGWCTLDDYLIGLNILQIGAKPF